MCGALLLAFGFSGSAFSQQRDPDQTYQQQLAEPGISDSAAVDITVAWLRTITQRTLKAPTSERIVYWNQIKSVVASSERIQGSPRGILIRVQHAISELARATIARQEATKHPKSEKKLQTARSIFRLVVDELQAIDKQSENLLHETYRKSASAARKSGWTRTQLESLRRNLALQRARTYRNQALCYPTGSPDSINSLSLALQSVADLTKSSVDEDVIWLARVEKLACLRLLKRFSEARQQLKQLRSADLPASIAANLKREASKLDLAEGKFDPTDGEKLSHSMRTAANLFSEGKLIEAIAEYDRAVEKFTGEGDQSRRFEAAQTAAAIARAMGDHKAASKRFRRLALDQPTHVEAAAVHLVAVGLAASLVRDADVAARPALTRRYVSLLQEHLQHWPQSNEAETVRLWLGRYWISREQWSRAVEVLAEIDSAAQTAIGKRERALAIYRKLLDQHVENGKIHESYGLLLSQSEQEEGLHLALQVWQRIEKQSKPAGPRWLRARQARLELLERLGKGEQAEKLLQLTKLLYPQATDSLEAKLPSKDP